VHAIIFDAIHLKIDGKYMKAAFIKDSEEFAIAKI
jgi:hypothetical protein